MCRTHRVRRDDRDHLPRNRSFIQDSPSPRPRTRAVGAVRGACTRCCCPQVRGLAHARGHATFRWRTRRNRRPLTMAPLPFLAARRRPPPRDPRFAPSVSSPPRRVHPFVSRIETIGPVRPQDTLVAKLDGRRLAAMATRAGRGGPRCSRWRRRPSRRRRPRSFRRVGEGVQGVARRFEHVRGSHEATTTVSAGAPTPGIGPRFGHGRPFPGRVSGFFRRHPSRWVFRGNGTGARRGIHGFCPRSRGGGWMAGVPWSRPRGSVEPARRPSRVAAQSGSGALPSGSRGAFAEGADESKCADSVRNGFGVRPCRRPWRSAWRARRRVSRGRRVQGVGRGVLQCGRTVAAGDCETGRASGRARRGLVPSASASAASSSPRRSATRARLPARPGH